MPRPIASSASPTSCPTSGSIPKLLNYPIQYQFLIQGLLHQDPGRFCQWDSSHNGQTCRQVSLSLTRHWLNSLKNECLSTDTRLREVDQVSADILNEQVCWHKIHPAPISSCFGQIMSHLNLIAGNQNAVFCFSLALPSPLTGCQALPNETHQSENQEFYFAGVPTSWRPQPLGRSPHRPDQVDFCTVQHI